MEVSELAQNEALRSLNSMMHNNLFPRMNVPRGSDDVMGGIANGYNMMGTIMEGIRARNDRNRLQDLLKQQFGNGENGQPAQNGDGYTVALGDTDKLNTFQNTIGNSLMSEQKPDYTYSLGDTDKLNSFRSIFGDSNATPVSNQAPQQDYSMQTFMRNAISKGMLPSNAMQAYSAYLAPVEQDIRDRNVREAMRDLAFADHGLSNEDRINLLAKINFNTGKNYAWEDDNNRFEQRLKYDEKALRPHGLYNPDLYTDVNQNYRVADDAFAQLGSLGGVNYGNYGGNYNSGIVGASEYGGNNENARAIYTYLANKGLPDNVIAGIMGNMEHESGFNHDAFNPNDADGTPSGGIIQWHNNRFDNLKNFAGQRGKDWKDLQTQLDFMVDELASGYPDLLQRMANLTPNEAALLFHKEYERSNDTPEEAAGRGVNATNIFNNRRSRGNYSNQTYTMPTQGANIDEQVKQLKPELQQALPYIGGILKNKFGVDGVISSGARSEEHNREVGGVDGSYHVGGNAIDIVLPDNTTEEQYKAIKDYFVRTGAFREVTNHDAGSGYHLHLGGYQGGDIARLINNAGIYSQQPQMQGYPQQRQSFGNYLAPTQVQHGGGARLSPWAINKLAMDQAEKNRLQYNDDRNFWLNQKRLEEQQRHNRVMEENSKGNGTGINKNVAGLFNKQGDLVLPYELNQPFNIALEELNNEMVDINKKVEAQNPNEKSQIPLSPYYIRNVVVPLKETYQYLVKNGVDKSTAKSKIDNLFRDKIKDLKDKDMKALYSEKRIADIIRDATSDESVESYNMGISAYRSRNDGSVIRTQDGKEEYLRGKKDKLKDFANDVERKQTSEESFGKYLTDNLAKNGQKVDSRTLELMKQQVLLDPRYKKR